jgi:hypothetical protein
MSKEDKKSLEELIELVLSLLDKGLHLGENNKSLLVGIQFLDRLKRDVKDGLVSIRKRDEKSEKSA